MALARSVALAVLAAAAVPPAARAQAVVGSAATLSDLVALDVRLQELARRVAPSVVQVIAYGYSSSPQALLARSGSSGAGVVVSEDGWIVTNAHVVDGARSVRVDLAWPEPAGGGSILRPRSRRLPARVVGLDRETDVAVLRIDEAGLPALAFGDSEALRQGQLVMAFGSPLGLENSAGLGVVSAVARQLRPDDPMIYVQTDASINPGNSGGPLLNIRGEIIGINEFIVTGGMSRGSIGIGFAIATPVLVYSGWPFYKGAWLGVRAGSLTMDLPIAIGVSITYLYSLYVTVTGSRIGIMPVSSSTVATRSH